MRKSPWLTENVGHESWKGTWGQAHCGLASPYLVYIKDPKSWPKMKIPIPKTSHGVIRQMYFLIFVHIFAQNLIPIILST